MKSLNRGQSLIEMIVAIVIIVTVIVALVGIATLAVNRSRFAKEQAQARSFAQEGMEWVRAERDKSWEVFRNRLGPPWGTEKTYCFNDPIMAWTAGACAGYDLVSVFKREAILNTVALNASCQGDGPNAKCVEVKITVSWQEGGRTHKSEQRTYLTEWQE